MKLHSLTLACLILLLHGEANAQTRRDIAALNSRITQTITLLEAKEYEKYFRASLPPERLRQIENDDLFDRKLNTFIQDKAEPLLRVFKKINRTRPKYGQVAGTTTATFYFRPDPDFKAPFSSGEITFAKIDGIWYIAR